MTCSTIDQSRDRVALEFPVPLPGLPRFSFSKVSTKGRGNMSDKSSLHLSEIIAKVHDFKRDAEDEFSKKVEQKSGAIAVLNLNKDLKSWQEEREKNPESENPDRLEIAFLDISKSKPLQKKVRKILQEVAAGEKDSGSLVIVPFFLTRSLVGSGGWKSHRNSGKPST